MIIDTVVRDIPCLASVVATDCIVRWFMPRRKSIEHPVRKMVSVSAETAKAIHDYRIEYSIGTESEAIRRLFKPGKPSA
jgi:hypothetical protein